MGEFTNYRGSCRVNEEFTLMDEQEDNQNKGCLDDIAGCGCGIVVLCVIFSAVCWAWNIHWLFGVLVLLVLLGFIR